MPTKDQLQFDVTDLGLYGYSLDNSLGKKLQETASAQLASSLEQTITQAMVGRDIVRNLGNGKTEYVAKFSAFTQNKLDTGEWKLGVHKDSDSLYGVIVDAVTNKDRGVVDLEKKVVTQLGDLPELLAIQGQLQAVSDQMAELSRAVQRVEKGQYNDRFAGVFTARQLIIEGLAANNGQLRDRMLMQAVTMASETTSRLMLALRDDAQTLSDIKTKPKEAAHVEELLQESLGYLNLSVQMSLAAYTALGEERSLLATLSNYRSFIKQVFLDTDSEDKRSLAWLIDNGHHGADGQVQKLVESVNESTAQIIGDVVSQQIGVEKHEEIEEATNLPSSGVSQGD